MINKVIFIIPLSILLFIVVAPVLIRMIFPGIGNTIAGESRLNKICFGIVIPKDTHQFVLQEGITFNDIRAKKNDCFGVDVYY
jgi:hypothetical protein